LAEYFAGRLAQSVERFAGRLAQSVEHLVYTERVGGSSPSPPTSGRMRLRVALGAVLGIAGLLGSAPASADSGSMTFRVQPLQADGCGARCPHVIVADGVIDADTPQAFLDFLKAGSDDKALRRVVFINSRGGNVAASMVFGHILRQLRAASVIGRFDSSGQAGPYAGQCLSACVYAMMGAVRRVAPLGSEVALHRMSIVVSDGGGWAGPARVTRSFADAPMVAELAKYASRMGVNPALVRAAESLPPDTVRVLTRDEMRRWSFATSQL
jgi:hypothetical protein